MSSILPCPLCKQPIELPAVNGQAVTCAICLHEFVVRAGRLAPRLDLDGLDIPVLKPDEPLPPEPKRDPRRNDDFGRPPTRRLSAREKPAPGRGYKIGFALIVVALVLGVVIVTNWPRPRNDFNAQRRRPNFADPFDRIALDQKMAELKMFETPAPDILIPPPQTRAVDAETDAEVRRFMSGVFDIVQALDRFRFVDLFDYELLMDRVMAVHPQHLFAGRNDLRNGLRVAVEVGTDRDRLFSDLNEFEVVSVRAPQGAAARNPNTVEVITRATKDKKGFVVRNRFWLQKQGAAWKIVDLEDMELNLRMSHLTSPLANEALDRMDPGRIATACASIREAMRRTANNDMAGAEAQLRMIQGALPDPLESARNFAAAVVAANRQPPQPNETLRLIDRARRFQNDAPTFDLFEAGARNQLNEWDKTLKILEPHRAQVGDDDQVCDYLGVAYFKLGRRAEAAAQFRKSLDYMPKNVGAFTDLVHIRNLDDPRDDLGRRFLLIDNPLDHFEKLVADCAAVDDWRGVDQLAGAALTLNPGHQQANFQMALAKIRRGKGEQAIPYIKKAVDLAFPRQRPESIERFTRELAQQGRGDLAYESAPNKADAFQVVGAELIKSFRFEDLDDLVARHRKTNKDTSLSILYEAIVASQRGDYERSDALFTRAEAMDPQSDLLAQQRSIRRLNRYRLGKAMSAYRDIGFKDEAFSQLAGLAWFDLDQPLLAELVKTHREAVGDLDDHMPVARWRLALLEGDPETLASAVRANLRRPNPARRQIIAAMAQDAVDAGKPLALYRALPDEDHRSAFVLLGGDLVARRQSAELKDLIAEHKKTFADDPWLDFFEAKHIWQTDPARAIRQKTVQKQVTLAYRRADAEARQQMVRFFINVNVLCDFWHDAYFELRDDRNSVVDIASLLAETRRWHALEELLQRHKAGREVALVNLSILLAVEQRNFDRATGLYQAGLLQCDAAGHPQLTREYVHQMAEMGRSLQAYRLVTDKKTALKAAAEVLSRKKQSDELETLLKEYEKNAPGDAVIDLYRGDIELDRGDLAKAEAAYKKALATERPDLAWRCVSSLRTIRIKKGEAAQALAENADGARTFGNLAMACLTLKDAGQLDKLLAARRKLGPATPETRRWEIQLLALKKDDAAIVKTVAALRAEKAPFNDRMFLADKLVRALVHLKKHDEAVREAEAAVKVRYADRLLLVLARAAQGDVAKTIEAAERMDNGGRFRFYRDPDLGPLLAQDAFRPFRDRFPQPADDEPFDPLFDDD